MLNMVICNQVNGDTYELYLLPEDDLWKTLNRKELIEFVLDKSYWKVIVNVAVDRNSIKFDENGAVADADMHLTFPYSRENLDLVNTVFIQPLDMFDSWSNDNFFRDEYHNDDLSLFVQNHIRNICFVPEGYRIRIGRFTHIIRYDKRNYGNCVEDIFSQIRDFVQRDYEEYFFSGHIRNSIIYKTAKNQGITLGEVAEKMDTSVRAILDAVLAKKKNTKLLNSIYRTILDIARFRDGVASGVDMKKKYFDVTNKSYKVGMAILTSGKHYTGQSNYDSYNGCWHSEY